ncbi:alkaline phosphatase family protein [bacterium]|nr:alkaline phosphatase family protein [candidate division CSSED10-310 bacterium]
MGNNRRAIIIGLDGATLKLLNPLMDSGDLPYLAEIRQKAAWGVLNSTIPPTTPPAWTSCTTGVNPGSHGIYDFTVSPLKNPARPLVSTKDVKATRLWKVVENQGGRSIVVNVPITYPPEKLDGCMVSGMMTPGFDSPFTSPVELRDRIKAVCGNYIPNVDIPKYDTVGECDSIRFLNDLRVSLERRIEAVRYLMESEHWTFFMVVFVVLDRIQHLFAKYLFPDNPLFASPIAQRLRPRLMEIIKRLDSIVGELIGGLKPGDTVFILSDHGFGTTDGFFNANKWLLDQGLLSVHTRPYLEKCMFNFAQQLGDKAWIRSLIPQNIQSAIRRSIRNTRSSMHSPRSDLADVVNWSETRVFFSSIPCQGFYINERTDNNPDGTVMPEDIDALKTLLKNRLLELKHPVSRERMTDIVWYREELFNGSETSFAPHVLFRMKDYSILGRQHLGATSYYTDTSAQPIGFHRLEGLLMMTGYGIQPGLISAGMMDIMPTILYSMGLDVPGNLDGRIISEGFSARFRSENPVRITDITDDSHGIVSDPGAEQLDDEETAIIEARLRNLGYLE